MELILNLIWLLISVLLVIHWIHVTPRVSASYAVRVATALLLVIVVLLPVISATDDLFSMAGLLEGEHSEHSEHVVRRGEMPLVDIQAVASPLSLALFALLFIDLSFFCAMCTRYVSRSQPAKRLEGFAETFGTRPPPFAFALA